MRTAIKTQLRLKFLLKTGILIVFEGATVPLVELCGIVLHLVYHGDSEESTLFAINQRQCCSNVLASNRMAVEAQMALFSVLSAGRVPMRDPRP